MYCKNCGNEFKNTDTKFCPVCGTKVTSNNETINYNNVKYSNKNKSMTLYIIILILSLIIVLFISIFVAYNLTKSSSTSNFTSQQSDVQTTPTIQTTSAPTPTVTPNTEQAVKEKICKSAVSYAENYFDKIFGESDIGLFDDDLYLVSIYWPDGSWACSIETDLNGNIIGIHEACDELVNEHYNNDYLFPSDREIITFEYLSTLSKSQVALIRNEIYARHGYIFQSEEYQQYFSQKAWYRPNPNFNESHLNAVELRNKEIIVEYESTMNWR